MGYVHELFFLVHEFQSSLGWAFDQSKLGSPPVNITPEMTVTIARNVILFL